MCRRAYREEDTLYVAKQILSPYRTFSIALWQEFAAFGKNVFLMHSPIGNQPEMEWSALSTCMVSTRRIRQRKRCVGSTSIDKGDFVFIVGPSGSEVHTSINDITRTVTRGHVLVSGRNIARLRWREVPMLRRRIGHIPRLQAAADRSVTRTSRLP